MIKGFKRYQEDHQGKKSMRVVRHGRTSCWLGIGRGGGGGEGNGERSGSDSDSDKG